MWDRFLENLIGGLIVIIGLAIFALFVLAPAKAMHEDPGAKLVVKVHYFCHDQDVAIGITERRFGERQKLWEQAVMLNACVDASSGSPLNTVAHGVVAQVDWWNSDATPTRMVILEIYDVRGAVAYSWIPLEYWTKVLSQRPTI